MDSAPSCEELTAEKRPLTNRLAAVEQAVEQQRRGGKRHAAPFSPKGNPEAEPMRSGSKTDTVDGRHGHRPVLGPLRS